MFRGKESSNRIKLSRLVQDLLNFGVLGSLWFWGWGVDGWGWGWLGGAPHTHAHACAHTPHTRVKHDNFMQMAAPIGGIPGNSPMSYTRVRACMCMHAHVCACVWGTPSHHPPPPSTHPLTPQGGNPRNHSKFNST